MRYDMNLSPFILSLSKDCTYYPMLVKKRTALRQAQGTEICHESTSEPWNKANALKLCSIIGTRPEAIKMAPIAIAAAARSDMQHRLIATGQQGALFDQIIAEFGLTIDAHLGHHPGSQPMDDQIAKMRAAIVQALSADRPDIVLVQGDTNSAYAAALAAHDLGIKIGHVEAGLRSGNSVRPWPEERNRIAISRIATLHFAPSVGAEMNLRSEDVPGTIFMTGNPGIDALMLLSEPSPTRSSAIPEVMVTCHRRENFGQPLVDICSALRFIASRNALSFVLPVHPNSEVKQTLMHALDGVPGITLIAPLGYRQMIARVMQSRFVVSDSGGLQEECAALGIPLVLLREETERPEVVASGNCVLVGSDHDQIVLRCEQLLNEPAVHARMSRAAFPYGNGDAACQILAAIGNSATVHR